MARWTSDVYNGLLFFAFVTQYGFKMASNINMVITAWFIQHG